MRQAQFTASGVDIGGHDAPPSEPRGPLAASRSALWAAVASLWIVLLLFLFAIPTMLRNLAPESQRVTAGDVTFIPAHGWTPVASPANTPATAVTYTRNGAEYTVWTQSGVDADAVAKQVTAQFFPAAAADDGYFVQSTPHKVLVRPRQSAHAADESLVVVSAVGDGGATESLGLSVRPGQFAVALSTGPPAGRMSDISATWGDISMMSTTIRARDGP